MTPPHARLPVQRQRDLWANRAARLLEENEALTARVAALEDTVSLLRLQLQLSRFVLPPDPAGPDPRWAGRIPAPRPSHAVEQPPPPAAAPRPAPHR